MEHQIHTKFDSYAYILTFSVINKNYRDWSTQFATSNIDQIEILGSWAYGKSNPHQIYI